MSHQQHYETVQLEREWLEEQEAHRVEAANEQAQEALDEMFRESIETKFPYLKGWK